MPACSFLVDTVQKQEEGCSSWKRRRRLEEEKSFLLLDIWPTHSSNDNDNSHHCIA
jgi:quinol monooxygenase YgiN